MPTATEFAIAASRLRLALDELHRARAPIDAIGDHGVHGGRLQELVDRAIEEQRHNLRGLDGALRHALEVAEYRQAVCEQYVRDHASWVRAASAWDQQVSEVGPNVMSSRPSAPSPPAPWAER